MKSLVIQSKQNASFKLWRKLLTSKGRKQSSSYLIEGYHLLEEALKHQANIQQVVVIESLSNQIENLPQLKDIPVAVISDDLAKYMSFTEAPQGVFAIIERPIGKQQDIPEGKRYLLLDGIQDPGNLGTMIRTAAAANYDAIIIGEGSVELYNDKVIRSSQGSIWHIPIIQLPLANALQILKEQQVRICGTALNKEALNYQNLNPLDKLAFVMGNEGQGVQKDILNQCDCQIYIPIPGHAESLNVAIAAAIIMFEYIC